MAAASWKMLKTLPVSGKVVAAGVVQLARRISVTGGPSNLSWQAARNVRELHHWPWCPRLLYSVLRSSQVMTYATQSEVIEKVKEEVDNLSPNKIFAVVHISGRQFKITQNDLIVINRISADIGERIILEKILLAGSENFTLLGTPLLSKEMVRVHATVTEHGKSAKVIVFKKKRRKNYKRKRGHRQDTTVLRINDIHLSSDNIQ